MGDDGQTVTGMLRLPILTLPDSPAWPDGTVTVTLPPSPTLEGVTPIQLGVEFTDQPQRLASVTDTLARPPAGARVNDAGDTPVGAVRQATVTRMLKAPIVRVPDSPAWPDGAVTVTLSPPDTLDGVTPIQPGSEVNRPTAAG